MVTRQGLSRRASRKGAELGAGQRERFIPHALNKRQRSSAAEQRFRKPTRPIRPNPHACVSRLQRPVPARFRPSATASSRPNWCQNWCQSAPSLCAPRIPQDHSLAELSLDPFDKSDPRLLGVVQRMQQTVAFLSLGMNPTYYWRYRAIAGTVRLIPGGRADFQNMKPDINSEEAEFMVAYCGATAF